MSGIMKSLAHSRWYCIYHLVFIPKYRRKTIYGEIREHLKEIFHDLARQKGCRVIEGHLMKDHVHMCLEIPPKYAVSSIVGFLKGKSALALARIINQRDKNFIGEHFWAKGYCVSTVGFELATVQKYIREQETADKEGRF